MSSTEAATVFTLPLPTQHWGVFTPCWLFKHVFSVQWVYTGCYVQWCSDPTRTWGVQIYSDHWWAGGEQMYSNYARKPFFPCFTTHLKKGKVYLNNFDHWIFLLTKSSSSPWLVPSSTNIASDTRLFCIIYQSVIWLACLSTNFPCGNLEQVYNL